jgi:hypothetical protein
MRIGNRRYQGPADLPDTIPLFPLPGALLLPRGSLPLNVFEPRYLAMVDDALAGERTIGMVQPAPGVEDSELAGTPPLQTVGGAGRIVAFAETGDGRYRITLAGISRFRILEAVPSPAAYRLAKISAADFAGDLVPPKDQDRVDRDGLVTTFKAYLDQNRIRADWDAIGRAPIETVVNVLAMISPFAPAEKQALLEASSLLDRAETLVALAEMALAGGGPAAGSVQ